MGAASSDTSGGASSASQPTESLAWAESNPAKSSILEASIDVSAEASEEPLPMTPEETANAVLQALKDGTLTEERIDESVRRILMMKCRRGLLQPSENRKVDAENG